ncbi:MAG: FAD:protein FMN transferase [Lachnospiraceae bacterium]
MKKTVSLIIAALCVMAVLVSCTLQTQQRYDASFLELFDTVTQIVGYADSKEQFTEYSQNIYDELEEYDHLFDIYNSYEGINNLKTINDNAGIEAVVVDQKIIDLLIFSKEMYQDTDGKVNVAMGSVLSLWHDYREAGLDDPEQAAIPDIQELTERAQHTNIDDIIIDEDASTVFLKDPEMSLDVGAIAKGYAVEEMADEIEEAGFERGMISVGGNVRSIGLKYDDSGNEVPWSVGIQNPDLDSEEATLCILGLQDLSLVTSGIYERYYVVDGKQYHHIIDPDTLMPAAYFASVSIVCEDSGLADALSTAVFNLPLEQGEALIESFDGVEALWVELDGTQHESAGFSAYIKE